MTDKELEELLSGLSELDEDEAEMIFGTSPMLSEKELDEIAEAAKQKYCVRELIMADQRKTAAEMRLSATPASIDRSDHDTEAHNDSIVPEEDEVQRSQLIKGKSSGSRRMRSIAAGAAGLIAVFGIGFLAMSGTFLHDKDETANLSMNTSRTLVDVTVETTTEEPKPTIEWYENNADRLYKILNGNLMNVLPKESSGNFTVREAKGFNSGDNGNVCILAMDAENVYFKREHSTGRAGSSDLCKYVMKTDKFELVSDKVIPNSALMNISSGKIYFTASSGTELLYSIDLSDGTYEEVLRTDGYDIEECKPYGNGGGLLLNCKSSNENFIKKIDENDKVNDVLRVPSHENKAENFLTISGGSIFRFDIDRERRSAVMSAYDSSGSELWSKELPQFCPELARMTSYFGDGVTESGCFELDTGVKVFGEYFIFNISKEGSTESRSVLLDHGTDETFAAEILDCMRCDCEETEEMYFLLIGDLKSYSLYAACVPCNFELISKKFAADSIVTNGKQLAYFDSNNDLNIITY